MRGDLGGYLQHQLSQIEKEVEAWDPDTFLTLPEGDIIEHFVGKFMVEAVVLDRAGIQAEPSQEIYTTKASGEEEGRILQTLITIAIPYAGDPDLFFLRPTTSAAPFPSGRVVEGELRLAWLGDSEDPRGFKQALDEQITAVEEHLARSKDEVGAYNRDVQARIQQKVQGRKKALLDNRHLEAAIGFPVRRREDAATYAVPIQRKKIQIKPLPTAAEPFRPEPALAHATYEEVLQVLRNTRNQLERSPSLTYRFGEEEIRNQLLLSLNGQFEGAAMGEVFNFRGKTDILIRADDRNVFIAECKIWDGPQTVTDGLNQLLERQLTWRDTKAALVLFIREGAPSEIIPKAVERIKDHPNFKRLGRHDEFGERHDFVLHANGDPARDINLAFLPFALPKNLPGRTQKITAQPEG